MPTPHTDCICSPECVCVCEIRQEIEREWVSEGQHTKNKHTANWLHPLCHIGTEIFLSFHTHTPKSNYSQKNRTQQRILGEGGFKMCVCVKIIILSNSSASLISLKAEAGLIANRCCIFKRFNLGCLWESGGQQCRPLFCDVCVCVCVCVFVCDMWQPYRRQVRPGVLEWYKIRPAPFLLRWLVIITPHHSLTNTHLHLYHSLFLSSRFLWPDPVHHFPSFHPGLFWPCLSPLCLSHLSFSLSFSLSLFLSLSLFFGLWG